MHTHTSRKNSILKILQLSHGKCESKDSLQVACTMHMVMSNHLINECFTIQIRILQIRFLSLRQVFGI